MSVEPKIITLRANLAVNVSTMLRSMHFARSRFQALYIPRMVYLHVDHVYITGVETDR